MRRPGLGPVERLPLRTRVMAAFCLASMAITSLLAVATWQLSSSYMLDQRERSAVRQARVNARLVDATMSRRPAGLPELLTGLGAEVESGVLLVNDGEWITSGNLVNTRNLPAGLVAMVQGGRAAHQRVVLDGVPSLVVGLPIPAAEASYVEVSPLRELDRTLRFLSWMLVAGIAVSGLAGALIGRWAATHALRPLTDLTGVAAAAAAGNLAVRLPATRDPDLAPLSAAFNETAERLQRRVARDERFAGDVSHELRSPLTTMLNAMAVLQRRRDELPPSARQAVELLGADLRRFRRMVDDLLDISRGDDELVLEPVDVAELVDRACATLPGTRPPVETSGDATVVPADRRRLERVIANLVDNANQHGGGLVRLAVLSRDGRARIEVDDAGPGVPPADRERVFERFARGSPAARRSSSAVGVGLGLALVAEHVRRHRGTAWVEDRPGGGARFVVELPAESP
ncbi:MAG TPA: HAMP domain-containing sensor histidine kinase [Pseudonocardiaceae bacterium]